jgi:sterol 14-demethylase
MPLGPKCLTFVVGPKTVAPFFRNRDDVFSQPEVYGFMTQVFGKGVVYDATPPKRKAQNVNMSRGLRADRLKSYVPKILRETEAYFAEKWGESGTADLLVTLSELTILTASRCLHGDDVRENLFAQVSEIYHDLDKGITPLSFFWPTAPVEGHRKRDAARLKMVELFGDVIKARRRQTPEQAAARTDILQVFVDMVYKDGTKATDDEITGLLIALLFAGQHTSSVTSTWTQLYILADDKLAARVRAEQADVVGGAAAPLVFDDLNKMALLHNCMKEALRMHPPLIMLMRKAMRAVPIETDAGARYVIPKGDVVFAAPAIQGRLATCWTAPDAFDPDRYAPGREEHAMPFAHIGFGGGIHQCMGQQFGYCQVKTILSWLNRNYDMEIVSEFPEPDYTAMVVGPKGKPMVRYVRKAAAAAAAAE